MKVLILGGGASGLMAALSAAQDEQNTVTVLERQSRVGRKLLATGNGRCNLTNLGVRGSAYSAICVYKIPSGPSGQLPFE